jgi:type I restriction enzyme S subunit
VAEIETQFTRLDAGVAALERALANLRRYRAAVLKAACEGRLVPTEAELARAEGREYEPADRLLAHILADRRARWGAEHPGKKYKEPAPPDTENLSELPEGWVSASFEQLLNELKNGYFGGRPATEPPGVPILRISAVRPLSVSFGDLRYLSEVSEDKLAIYQLREGDLLFTRYNGNPHLVAACGLVRKTSDVILYPDKLIRARVSSDLILPSYLEAYFSTNTARYFIESKIKTTAGQYGIAGRELKQIPIVFPPLPEQRRIVAEVERRLSVVEALEREVEAALARAGRLRQAVLKQAFEGRLVEQDPEDELASVLLERIRATREARAAGRKKRKTRQMRLPEM